MKLFKVIFNISLILFALCIPVLFLTVSISVFSNSAWFYNWMFERNNVAQDTGFTPAQLDNIAHSFISYFRSGDGLLQITEVKDGQPIQLFTPDEQLHYQDVKGLFQLNSRGMYVTLAYVSVIAIAAFLYKGQSSRRGLAKAVIGGGALTLALIALIGAGVVINFDWLWLQFHYIGFSNDFWSSSGYMIMLTPEGFWYDAVTFCGLAIVGLVVISGAMAAVYLNRSKRLQAQTGQ